MKLPAGLGKNQLEDSPRQLDRIMPHFVVIGRQEILEYNHGSQAGNLLDIIKQVALAIVGAVPGLRSWS